MSRPARSRTWRWVPGTPPLVPRPALLDQQRYPCLPGSALSSPQQGWAKKLLLRCPEPLRALPPREGSAPRAQVPLRSCHPPFQVRPAALARFLLLKHKILDLFRGGSGLGSENSPSRNRSGASHRQSIVPSRVAAGHPPTTRQVRRDVNLAPSRAANFSWSESATYSP